MKIFGAALDALPHPEKVALKKAYLRAAGDGRVPVPDPADPCEALRPLLLADSTAAESDFIGRFPVETIYTPKPKPEDADGINSRTYFDFLDGGGCRQIALSLKEFVEAKVLPEMPFVMLGVDHSLTGGPVMALSEMLGRDNLAVAVFDGHFDAVSPGSRAAAFKSIFGNSKSLGSSKPQIDIPDACTCETFLKYLLDEKWLLPQNIVLVGPYDYPDQKLQPDGENGIKRYVDEYRRLETAGVTVLPRDVVRKTPESLAEVLAGIDARYLYVSLDLDVAASAENPAVRFHDSTGLAPNELYALTTDIAEQISQEKFILAGVDVMEMDIHLIDVQPRKEIENRTLEIAARFLKILLGFD